MDSTLNTEGGAGGLLGPRLGRRQGTGKAAEGGWKKGKGQQRKGKRTELTKRASPTEDAHHEAQSQIHFA